MSELDHAALRQRQSLPLEAKVLLTKSRIRQWYDHWEGDVYVSFSGGKDSTVLLDLVKGMYPDVPAVFCDTGLEYPEVRELGMKKADVVLKPKMNFTQVIKKYGYPIPSKEQALFIREYRNTNSERLKDLRINGRGDGTNLGMISTKWVPLIYAPFQVSEKCCEVMKKAPFRRYAKETARRKMTAVMASESNRRMVNYLKYGCNAFDAKEPSSTPMAFWTEQDVLRYIVDRGLEYAGCYGEIIENNGTLRCTRENRTGCMFCMFGVHLDGNPNRFQRMQRDYPMQWRFCMEQLGIREVLDYVGFPYEYQPTLFDLPTDEGGCK